MLAVIVRRKHLIFENMRKSLNDTFAERDLGIELAGTSIRATIQ